MKHCIFYSNQICKKPDSAHEIHDVMCANAAANLGISTVLTYPETSQDFLLSSFFSPFKPQQPERDFVEFFNVQESLKVAILPVPRLFKSLNIKLINSGNLIYKYYLPFHVFPMAKVIYTRNWSCVKAAVQYKIPTIYEKHYFQKIPFEPEIVNSRFFKISITQSEPIRESLIKAGMPPEKVVWMHNGFSPSFLERQLEEAQVWRNELLDNGHKHLVVYSGALYPYKGVNLLIDVAKQLPQIQFALTGGTEKQVEGYRQQAREKQVENMNFLGWILPRSRLISLLQAADILAHPHCSGREANFTNPVKFFQYMASGTPIVATEIPPLIPFKSSPMAAAWCPPDNPTAFAQCIAQVLQIYPRKIEGYGQNMEFSRQFSWEERSAKILNYVNYTWD